MKTASTRLNLGVMEVRATPAVLAHPNPVAAAPAAQVASLAVSKVTLQLSLDDPSTTSTWPVRGNVKVKNESSQAIHYQVLVYWSPTSTLSSAARGADGSQGFHFTSREVKLPKDGYVIAKLVSMYTDMEPVSKQVNQPKKS